MSNKIFLNSSTDLSSFYVIFNGSSSLEYDGCRGYSHICEHLLCENFVDMFDELQKDFIEWNAYTSCNQIVFYFKGFNDKLLKYKNILIQKLTNFNFTQEQLDQEKFIIIQEYYDSVSSPFDNLYSNVHRKLFDDYLPIGSIEDIKNCTLESINKWLDTMFSQPSLILTVSKDIKTDDFDPSLTLAIDDFDRKQLEIEDFIKINETDELYPIVFVFNKADQHHKLVDFLISYFSDGLNSPMYELFRNKNQLCYSLSYSMTNYGEKYHMIFGLTTSKTNVDKVKENLGYFASNIDDFLTKERFEIVKSNMLLADRKREIFRYSSADKYFENSLYHSFDNELQDLTYEAFIEIVKYHMNLGYEVYTPEQF